VQPEHVSRAARGQPLRTTPKPSVGQMQPGAEALKPSTTPMWPQALTVEVLRTISKLPQPKTADSKVQSRQAASTVGGRI